MERQKGRERVWWGCVVCGSAVDQLPDPPPFPPEFSLTGYVYQHEPKTNLKERELIAGDLRALTCVLQYQKTRVGTI